MRSPFSTSVGLIVVLSQISVPTKAEAAYEHAQTVDRRIKEGAFEKKAGLLRLRVRDAKGDLLPARVHLHDAAGKPVRPEGLPFWRDHFVCPGQADLPL